MNLQKLLDKAIKNDESPIVNDNGFDTGTKCYDTYMSNTEWEKFLSEMSHKHRADYDNGSGGELEVRKSDKNIFPPKMASYGSSSRMIYNLAKDIENFNFEEKLPTTVGGIANLDGFFENDNTYIFIEAKCREPYGTKVSSVEIKYKDLYRFISDSTETSLCCNNKGEEKSKMNIEFSYNGTVISHFDIKQMICHLLGVATAFLNGKYTDKDIKFLYLLYNPTLISPPNEPEWEDLIDIYDQTCNECNMIDFSKLYYVIFEYLKIKLNKSDVQNKSRFTFRLCDRNNFRGEILC